MKVVKNKLIKDYHIHYNTLNKYINKLGIVNCNKVTQKQYNELIELLNKNKDDRALMETYTSPISLTGLDDLTKPTHQKQIIFDPTYKSIGARLLKERELYNELLTLREEYKARLDYALNNNVNVIYIQIYNNLFLQVNKQIEKKDKLINEMETHEGYYNHQYSNNYWEYNDIVKEEKKAFDKLYGIEEKEEETYNNEDEEEYEDEYEYDEDEPLYDE